MKELIIARPDDWHVHLRQGDALKSVVSATASVFGAALVMPNIRVGNPSNGRPAPPVQTAGDALKYRKEILAHTHRHPNFNPLMTISLTDETIPKHIVDAAAQPHVIAAKTYPKGITTNSEWGVSDFEAPQFIACLRQLAARGMVWCIHPETEGFVLDRESEFVHILSGVLEAVPDLRIVVEHVTSGDMVRFVKGCGPNVAATITAHHLWITLDDVIGGSVKPDHFCKPVAKYPSDRKALQEVVFGGHPRFFFGSDSAPHTTEAKYCASGCAGIFSAPVAMASLAHIFEANSDLGQLEGFVSTHGRAFYGLDSSSDTLVLERKPWKVPLSYANGLYTPFLAGKTLNWRVQGQHADDFD